MDEASILHGASWDAGAVSAGAYPLQGPRGAGWRAILRTTRSVALVGALSTGCAAPEDPAGGPDAPAVDEALDAALRAALETAAGGIGTPGATVAAPGQPTWFAATG